LASATSYSLGSHAYAGEPGKGQNKTIIHGKVMTAAGFPRGVLLPPGKESTGGKRQKESGPDKVPLFRGDLDATMSDPWFSRFAFQNLARLRDDVVRNNAYTGVQGKPNTAVPGMLKIAAPNAHAHREGDKSVAIGYGRDSDKKNGVTKANWFVMTFGDYFQVAFKQWWTKVASDEQKKIFGNSDQFVRKTETGQYFFYVLKDAWVDLLTKFSNKYNMVNHAMNLSHGLRLVVENEDDPKQNEALFGDINEAKALLPRMVADPLITKAWIAAEVQCAILTPDTKVDELEYPDDSKLVSGKASLYDVAYSVDGCGKMYEPKKRPAGATTVSGPAGGLHITTDTKGGLHVTSS